MTDLFVDTSVLLTAVGGDHPDRAPCRSLVAAAADGRFRLHASVEAVQEFVFHRTRRVARDLAVRQTRKVSDGLVLHPFDEDVLAQSLDLCERTGLRGRDAVHVATAQLAGFDTIVSLDSDFDGVSGIRLLHPIDVV